MAITTYTSATIRGVTYNKGDPFVCAYSAGGNGGSDGTSDSAAALSAGTTYYFSMYATGSDVEYPYAISTSSGGAIYGWYKENVFPYAKYTIKYNANGGSGAPNSQTKTYGTSLTLSSTKPTRAGYTFKGWALSKSDADNGIWYYQAGSTCGKNENLTLYATWEEHKLTVNYYSNYATDAGDNINAVGSDKNVLVKTVSYSYSKEYTNGLLNYTSLENLFYLRRVGYATTGYWGTSQNGGNLVHQTTSFATGQALAQALGKNLANGNASVSVYPQWKINTYTFKYEPNGGSGTTNSITVEWGETFVLPDNSFKHEGYKFVGWNVHRNADSTWYVTGQGWITEDEILNGGYEKKLYTSQEEHVLGNSWIKGIEYTVSDYTMYTVWEISGVVYIDNGTTLEPYLTYIDNGTGWDLYLAYVDDGTNWTIIS